MYAAVTRSIAATQQLVSFCVAIKNYLPASTTGGLPSAARACNRHNRLYRPSLTSNSP
jgi:hypothetical protein